MKTKRARKPVPQVTEAFTALAELALALGASPLNKHPACWECQIDHRWRIAINGHREPKLCSFSNVALNTLQCYIEFNGRLVGSMSPIGGVIATGDAANEDTFITAVRARLVREKALTRGT